MMPMVQLARHFNGNDRHTRFKVAVGRFRFRRVRSVDLVVWRVSVGAPLA